MNGSTYEVAEPEDKVRMCHCCDCLDGDDCTVDVEKAGFCYKDFRKDDRQVVFKKMEER